MSNKNNKPWELTPQEVTTCRTHNGEGFVDLEKLEHLAQKKLFQYLIKNCIYGASATEFENNIWDELCQEFGVK